MTREAQIQIANILFSWKLYHSASAVNQDMLSEEKKGQRVKLGYQEISQGVEEQLTTVRTVSVSATFLMGGG